MMCQVCPRLCGVAEQTFASVPARDPDRLIKWFIGVVVIASGSICSPVWLWRRSGPGFPGRPFCGPISRCVEFWSSAARALWHSAGSGHGFARTDRLCGGHRVGICDWVAS